MNKRIKSLRGDLRYNETQFKLVTRNLGGIATRIQFIKKELAEAEKAMEGFSLFDVD